MKASAPEEESRNGNCEGPCHLEKKATMALKTLLSGGRKTCTKSDSILHPPPTPVFSQRVVDAFLFPLTHLFCAVS